MEKKTSEAKKKKTTATTELEEPISQPPNQFTDKIFRSHGCPSKSSHSDDFRSEFTASLLRTQISCTVDQGSTVLAQPMSCCFTGSPWMKMILGDYG